MDTDDELMDGEADVSPLAVSGEQVPVASLAPGVESLAEDAPEAVPPEEQEDPYEGRDMAGEAPAEAEEGPGEDDDGAPAEEAPAAAEGQVSPWPRRESALPPPAPQEDEGRARYWQRVLTGDPDTVPDDVRSRAVAQDAGESAEEREYRMLSAINRSWAADHSEVSREELRASWPQRRAELAKRLGAADNEQELFTALSLEERDAPRREAGRAIYERAWRAGVLGQQPIEIAADGAKLNSEDMPRARGLATHAYSQGEKLRGQFLPLAQQLASGLDAFAAMEEDVLPAVRVLPAAPELASAIEGLAGLEEPQRRLVYALAQDLLRQQSEARSQEGVLLTARRSVGRGAYNAGLGIGQLLGNMSVSVLGSLGNALDETLGTDFAGASRGLDLRARIF